MPFPRIVLLVLLSVLLLPASALAQHPLSSDDSVSVASLKGPAPAAPLPAASEGFAPYVGQSSCDPVERLGVQRFRDAVLKTYQRGRSGGIVRNCSVGGTSEHKEGRAWDWMLNAADPADRAAADQFHAWLLAPGPDGKPAEMARRTGVMYIIWDKRMWSSYRASDGWQPYTGASPHTDHIHVSFSWEGALGATSFWDGTVAAPDYGPCRLYTGEPAPLRTGVNPSKCPSTGPAPVAVYRSLTWLVSQGVDVSAAQKLLGLPVDGVFGSTTRNKVLSYQGANSLPKTGAMDSRTWAKLDPSSVKPPALSLTVSSPGTVTGTSVVEAVVTSVNGGAPSKVVFKVNGAAVSTDTTSPYSFNWDTRGLVDGTYSLQMVATEARTNQEFTSVVKSVVVKNAPTGSFTTQTSLSRRLSVSVKAHSPVTTVARVEVRIDGRLVLSDQAAPYGGSFFVARGSRVVSVKIVDAQGRSTTLPSRTVAVR